MTRYDIIQRFAGDNTVGRDQRYTFFVLAEMWADVGRPDQFEPSMQELIRLTKARRSNLYRWLGDLDAAGYIHYIRGGNQNRKPAIRFTFASIQNGTAEPLASSPNETAQPLASSPTETATQLAGIPTGTANHSPVAEMGQQASSRSGTAPPSIVQKRGFEDKSSTAQPDLDAYTNNLVSTLNSVSQSGIQTGDEGKGVQGKNRKATRRVPQGCLFVDSPLASLDAFKAALATDPTGQKADLDYYFQVIANWRNKAGQAPLRTDWISTARTFMLNDYREGKLVPATPKTSTPSYAIGNRNSRSRIEPAAGGSRSFGGSWTD